MKKAHHDQQVADVEAIRGWVESCFVVEYNFKMTIDNNLQYFGF
jgi:hypothetical protein